MAGTHVSSLLETPIIALGYAGGRSDALEDWRGFGVNLLGLELEQATRADVNFRMDGAARRLMFSADAAEASAFFGWEVADGAVLSALAARLESHGYVANPFPRALCDRRGVKDGVITFDPAGNRIELFYGQEQAPAPFTPGRALSGFRTGGLGMGHAVLHVESIDGVMPFYCDILGFKLSDYALRPFKAYFFHINARHHSLALIETGGAGIHHLMMEVQGIDDLGQGYDLAQLEEGRVATTLGRHSNDHMVSFYVRTPSGFLIEYGWGGRSINPSAWAPVEMNIGPSLWGHERDWLPPETRDEARRLRLAAASAGVRAPLDRGDA